MSDHAPHDAHGASPDHVPHVTPLPVYLVVFAALICFTVLTVVVSRFDFGGLNLVIAMTVATIKATLVALFFMHLYSDNKFHAVILVSSLLFLGIFIIFTSFDTFNRGRADQIEESRPQDISNPFEAIKGAGFSARRLQRAHPKVHGEAADHAGHKVEAEGKTIGGDHPTTPAAPAH